MDAAFVLAFLFGFHGRINRAKYWLAMLIYFIVGLVLMLAGLALGKSTTFRVICDLVNLAIFVSSLAVTVKRLHDRDRSAWWLLLFYTGVALAIVAGGALMWAGMGAFGDARVVSLFLVRLCLLGGIALGVWSLVEIGFRRGTTGYNRFGPDPLAKRPQVPAAAAPALR
jgi:uncharacterized membrane protein YhaH (DUF805 family)